MTHRALLVEVWGAEYEDDIQVLRAHIANLRRKIEPRRTAPSTSAPTPASATASPPEQRLHRICIRARPIFMRP